MDDRNITAANSTAILIVEELYPSGVTLEGYSTDQAITQGEETLGVTRMGMDGQMVGGYTPSIKVVNLTFEPSSNSISVMDTIYKATQTNKKPYKCRLLIEIPSIQKTYTYNNGIMVTGKAMPDLKQVLDPMNYGFNFEGVTY